MDSGIIGVRSTALFFWDLVKSGGLTPDASAYVASVLVKFTKSGEVFSGVDHGHKVKLFDFIERAQSVDAPERRRIYAHLGDVAMFVVSFFPESLPTSRSYYTGIGGSAYRNASALSDRVESAIYDELSANFEDVVETLSNGILRRP